MKFENLFTSSKAIRKLFSSVLISVTDVMIAGIKKCWNIKQMGTRYGTIINILKPIIYDTMKASLCWVSFQISRLILWNKTMLFKNFANGIEIYGADSFNMTRSIPNISLLDSLGRDSKYVSMSLLDILLKRKLWIPFGPFQKRKL